MENKATLKKIDVFLPVQLVEWMTEAYPMVAKSKIVRTGFIEWAKDQGYEE